MIIVRDVFKAKYGKGGDLVALFKEAADWEAMSGTNFRILTDASGPMFTVVTEYEVESLSGWENRLTEIFSNPGFGEWFARMEPLVESGHRQFYNIA